MRKVHRVGATSSATLAADDHRRSLQKVNLQVASSQAGSAQRANDIYRFWETWIHGGGSHQVTWRTIA